ncbi:hypothetical protein N8146_05950 [Ascidiaceihabitans sp.]|nr:hypothetical protein [Ascidiaceihabitans sp.]
MGAAGAGGSNKSDDKKVDTYSDQLKKIQARKSKTKKDKFGYTVKKNIIERYVDNNPIIQGVKNVSDKMNLNRRMKFANKNNINLQGLSTEQILSKDFKSQLDAKGYTRETPTGNNNGGNDNNNQPDLKIGIFPRPDDGKVTTLPYKPSGAEDKKEATKYDERVTKKKGKRKNILTSSQGITKLASDYSLSDKTLLGRVV